MIDQLITALNQEMDLSAEEIADTIWLALQINQSTDSQKLKDDNPQIPLNQKDFEKEKQEIKKNQLSESGKVVIAPHNPQKNIETPELPFKVPNARSLREPLPLAQALKPLISRIPFSTNLVLDEAATAQRIANEGLWLPVFKPTLEPWLDLELVIDESISMQIWWGTIRELERLLKNYGIFRDVRVWGLISDENSVIVNEGKQSQTPNSVGSKVKIRRGFGTTSKNQSPRSPKELIDHTNRRLVLVVSDCVSSLWRNGEMTKILELWANHLPIAIIQMLPESLWIITALREELPVRLQGLTAWVANQYLITKEVSLWYELDKENEIKVPIFTLEPHQVATWAQMLSGKSSIWTLGYVFNRDISRREKRLFQRSQGEITPQQLVMRFQTFATPMARELAVLLSASPVISLPVVRLIQETMLKDSLQVNVAEVFLGGLLNPISEINVETNPDDVLYDFIDGVRDILLDDVALIDALDVLDKVSEYIAKKAGLSLEEFTAVLRKEQVMDDSNIALEIDYFAKVTAQIFRHFGEEYKDLIDSRESIQPKPMEKSDQATSVVSQEEPETKAPQKLLKIRINSLDFETLELHEKSIQQTESAQRSELAQPPLQDFNFEILELHQQKIRYLNAGFCYLDSEELISPDQPLALDFASYRLKVNIGEFFGIGSPDKAFPEKLLESFFEKEETLEMDVFVHSFDVDINSPQQKLKLSKTGDSDFLDFPVTFTRTKRHSIDIDLLFHGHLLQSKRVEVYVVEKLGDKAPDSAFPVQDAYITWTRSTTLEPDELTFLKENPRRLTIVTERNINSNRISLRFYDNTGKDLGVQQSELENENLTEGLIALREQLKTTMTAYAGTVGSTKAVLTKHLGLLAEIGREFYLALLPGLAEQEKRIDQGQKLNVNLEPKTIIQIAPLSSQLGVPWELLYERKIESYREERIKLCPTWHQHGSNPEDCPSYGKMEEAITVCPHSFWGYHYIIEQLPCDVEPHHPLPNYSLPIFIRNSLPLRFNAIIYSKFSQLASHLQKLSTLATETRIELVRSDTLDTVQSALAPKDSLGNPDLTQLSDIIYFYAHGGKIFGRPYLEIGDGEKIKLTDLDAWDLNFYDRPPLIVLNACESADYTPQSFENLLKFFCKKGAAGVIGTQCEVKEKLANAFIVNFFQSFLEQYPAGEALFKSRQSLLREHLDPRGLAYSLFASADVQLAQPVVNSDSEIAKIRNIEKGFVGLGSKLQLTKSHRKAQYDVEHLGNGITLEMVYIPSGNFLMGSPEGEGYKFEKPQHQVTVPSFFMGKYPVTQVQWRVIAEMTDLKVNIDLHPNPSYFQESYQKTDPWTRPVERVNWYEAQEFCYRLSKLTGKEYKLPTEAEWEYACRAVISYSVTSELTVQEWNEKYHQPFHFGETIITDLANYQGTDKEIRGKIYPGNYGRGPKGEYREETTPVGIFPANAFGLYDMHGNVWEWCEDDWHENYCNGPNDGSAWLSEDIEDTNYKILRGGSYDFNPNDCRSASRFSSARDNIYSDIGFRVVCVLPRTF